MEIIITIASAVLGIALGLAITFGLMPRRRHSQIFHEGKVQPPEKKPGSILKQIHLWHVAPTGTPPRVYIGWLESTKDSEEGESILIYPFSIAGAGEMAAMLEQAAQGKGDST